MLKGIALGLVILGVCVGCSSQGTEKKTSTQNTLVKSTASIPVIGSEDWLVWVEKSVGTADGAGHGPDYGSQEWCFVVEKKLFTNASGITPCTVEWNQKVTDALLKSVH